MFELTAYQRSRLAADEQVFWCGKTRPVARFAAWPLFVVFGVVACAMAMFSPFLRSVWWLVRRDGTPTAVKIGFALFALPFVGVALGFLLSPLWHWIYTRGSVWVITDLRVIRFFGPFAKSWGYDKLFEYVEWSSAGHGCLDFAFSEHWVNSKGGGYMMTDCIENVRKKGVPFVKAAFQRLSECRRAGEAARQTEKMSGVAVV